MSILLQLSPETEARLRDLASERGVEIEALAGEAVSLFAAKTPPTDAATQLMNQLQSLHRQLDDSGFAGIDGAQQLRAVRDDV